MMNQLPEESAEWSVSQAREWHLTCAEQNRLTVGELKALLAKNFVSDDSPVTLNGEKCVTWVAGSDGLELTGKVKYIEDVVDAYRGKR